MFETQGDCLALHSHSGDFQHHMETTSCFSYFCSDVIGCCSTLLVCVFYNWPCLVHCCANNNLSFCSSLGMAKLYQQRPSLTRLQTNVKVCDFVLFLTSPLFILLLIKYAQSSLTNYPAPCLLFTKVVRKVVRILCVNSV